MWLKTLYIQNLHIICPARTHYTNYNQSQRRRLSNESAIFISADDIARFDFTIILNVKFFILLLLMIRPLIDHIIIMRY